MGRVRIVWLIIGLSLLLSLLLASLGCRASADPLAAASPTSLPPTQTPVATPSPTHTATSTPSPTPSPSPTPTPTSTPAPSPTHTAVPKPAAVAPKIVAASGGPLAPLIVRGDASKAQVSLTFDSGSGAGSIAEILNILRENGIHTTFFITGAWAEANPALAKRMVAEGHRIANHSFTHPDLTTVSDDAIVSELSRTEETIRRIAGVSSKPYFRPPFGAYDNRVLRVLAREGYKAIYWTLDSTDWRDEASADSVRRRVVNNADAGSIVVHHSSPEKTAKALPLIIRQLREKGLQIVNLPELLGE